MATMTLSALRTALREAGDYENSVAFSDSFLTRAINAGLAELYDELIKTWADYYTTETTLTTTASQNYVNLPATFYKLIALDIEADSGTDGYASVRRGTWEDRNLFIETGKPRRYMLIAGGTAGRARLFPIPDAQYTLRVFYIPQFTKLSADGDTFDMVNCFEELPVHLALRFCYQREDRATGELDREIARLYERVRSAADTRDVSEPDYLSDHREHSVMDGEAIG
jgi:hypothetical protein